MAGTISNPAGSVTSGGGIFTDVTVTTGNLTIALGELIITTATTPASAAAVGVAGTIAWDADYLYVCVATNTWKRTAIATWP